MSFKEPLFLFGLLLVAMLLAAYLFAQRRRRKFVLRFTDLALVESVAGRGAGRRKHVPPAFFLVGAALLVIAAAQPVMNLEVARNDASVVLVIDTSGSMDATDVQPTRMDAARAAAHTLIDELPANNRIGLVSFSGSAVLASPLTDNRDQVSQAVDSLYAGGATAIGDALELAVKQFPAKNGATDSQRTPEMIVLLTDGVTNRGTDPLEAAAQAKAAGIVVNTIGVGSHDPSVLVHGQPVGGVDETALGSIASATGGKYTYAESNPKLTEVFSTLGSQFAWRPLKVDMTVPLVLVAVLVVVAAAGASLWWFRVLP